MKAMYVTYLISRKQKTRLFRALLQFWVANVILLFVVGFAHGQYLPFRFERFGLDDGLSNQLVTCVIRDKTGYLWVGTEKGLNRYDGYGFKHFLPDTKNKTSLRDSAISALLEDRKGNLWVGTKVGGLHLFDRRTETFHVFQHGAKSSNGVSDNRIYRIYEDAGGNLWIGTAGGLDKVVWDGQSPETIRFTSFRYDANNPESLSHNRVTAMAQDSAGRLWVGTKLGLNRMVSETPARFERFLNDKNVPNSLPDNEVYSLLFDKENNLWIGMWGGPGLSKIHASELSNLKPNFQSFPYDSKTGRGLQYDIVLDMIEDRQGNIWFCTGDNDRLAYLPRDERNQPKPRFLYFTNDEGNPLSLSDGSVSSVFEDTQGLIWIALRSGGLNKLDTGKSVFRLYRHHPGNVQSLSAPFVSSVAEDTDNSIWVGSENGLTQIVPGTELFSEPTFIHYKGGKEEPSGLRTNIVETLLVDSKGRLWVGTINGGLHLRQKQGSNTTFVNYVKDPKNPNSIGNNVVLTMLEDSRGTIWVGTYQGLYKVVEPSQQTPQSTEITFASYRHKKDDPNTLSNDTIEALAEGPDGSIWAGTMSGLNHLNTVTGKVTRYMADDENPNSISHEIIASLYTSSKGVLWIGTDGGLCKFDFGTKTISRVSPETKLSDLMVKSFSEDLKGNLWVGTIHGLFRFDPERNVSRHFGKNDGLQSEIFGRNTNCKGKDGTLYFGGPNGLAAFNPKDVNTNNSAPPVVLTELLLGNRVQAIQNQSVLPAQIQFLDKLVLSHTDNIFSIEFSALNFKQTEDNRYAYKLEGLTEDWIETDGKNRRATFTNLSHGEYIFRVKAANKDGVWNESGTSLKIVILPPWWKTWWAQILFYTFVIILLLAVPFIRLSMLKKQRTFLESQVKEQTSELRNANQQLVDANRAKSSFLSNMSHELRTPLNAVIGFAQLMGRDSKLTTEQRGSLGIIQRSGEHLLGLINDVLSISKIEAGRLSLYEKSFDPRFMLRSVEEMLRVRAESKNLTLWFDIAEDLPNTVKGDEGKLRQVLVNLLGNAIKFTDEGGVTLRCSWSNDGHVHFQIEDTGVGIAEADISKLFEAFFQTEKGQQSKEGTGLGLAISRQIIRLMGGDITVKSNLGVGTIFLFDVNLSPSEDVEVQAVARRKVAGLDMGQSPPRVLVVDDTFENRILLCKLLSSVGIEVSEAANGEEALELWSNWQPHLIFMDLRMPVLDGYEATRQIRSQEKSFKTEFNSKNGGVGDQIHNGATQPDVGKTNNNEHPQVLNSSTKIIALTASAFEHERGTIIEQGADDFVTKPFREETIFQKISEHLGTRFRYEVESQIPNDVQTKTDLSILKPERFAVVSPDLLAQLEHALKSGNDVKATNVADELQAIDPALSAAVSHAVKNFDFDLVLRAMKKD